MKTHTITPDEGTDPTAPSPMTLLEACSSPYRCHTLSYLRYRSGPVPLTEIVEHVAAVAGEPTRNRYEQVRLSLLHAHVPHLTDRRLVRYDADRETVELRIDPAVLQPYVRLATGSEFA